MNEQTVSFQLLGVRSDLQQDLLQVEVYGSGLPIIVTGKTAFDLLLKPGVYRARLSGGWGSRDTLFLVEPKAQQRIELEMPPRYSSAPMPDAMGHHEYYIASFSERGVTRDPLNVAANAQTPHLFFYIRMRDERHAQHYAQAHQASPQLFTGLKLLDSTGQCLTRFADDEVHQIPAIGMARFRAQIAPGYYRLVYTDPEGKIEWMPLPVLPLSRYVWDTDVTMMWDGRPLFSTISLFTPAMRSGNCCDLYDYDLQINAIDTVIQTLATGQRVRALKSETVRQLLSDKFANPMMGILGMYLYLLRDNLNAVSVQNILQNLDALAPGSPDVEALRVIAWERGLIPLPNKWRFEDIPLVRIGAMAMQRATLSSVDFLLPAHAEQLFMHMNASTPWSQTGCVHQSALERPEAMAFDASMMDFDQPFVAEVQPETGAVPVEMIKPLKSLIDDQKRLVAPVKSFSLRPDFDSKDLSVPNWLTEMLLKKLPELQQAQRKGELNQSIDGLAQQSEVLRPTVAKLVNRLLA